MKDGSCGTGGRGVHISLQSLKANSRYPSSRLLALFCFSLPTLPQEKAPHSPRRSLGVADEKVLHRALPPFAARVVTAKAASPSRHGSVCRESHRRLAGCGLQFL